MLAKEALEQPKELEDVLLRLLNDFKLFGKNFDERCPQADLALANLLESGMKSAPYQAFGAV